MLEMDTPYTEPKLRGQVMKEFSKYVGLDVHKDTIAVSIADAGRSKFC